MLVVEICIENILKGYVFKNKSRSKFVRNVEQAEHILLWYEMMKFKTFYFYLIFCELEHKQRSIALVAMKWATKLLKSEIEISIFFKSVDIFSEPSLTRK